MFPPGFGGHAGPQHGDIGSPHYGFSSSSDNQQPKPVPPFDNSEYSMMFFKVLPCLKVSTHGWTVVTRHLRTVMTAAERRELIGSCLLAEVQP